jgi:signal transduction histidine kinase
MRGLFGSARARILAFYVVLLAFSGVVTAVLIGQILTVRTSERVQDSLVQEVDEFRELTTDCVNPQTRRPCDDLETLFDVYFSRNVPSEGETILTFIGEERYERRSSARGRGAEFMAAAARWVRLNEAESGSLDTSIGEVRYLAVPVRRGSEVSGTFVVTAALGQELEEVREAVVVTIAVEAIVLLLASLLAWIVAGRVLAPLRLLSDTARAITETDLTRRIPVRGTDEIAELARTFNAMLDRLQTAFDAQRDFVNDASHELRTPITIVRGHLELLGDDPDERSETVALVTDELDRMSRFVDDLLLLAKAGRRDFLTLEDVDLDQLTDELLAKARALGARDWHLDSRASFILSADRQRLTQAMMGLAQNATQHTEDGEVVALGTAVRDGTVRLWVRDEGPGIPRTDQARIFERFARASGGRRRSEGAGLGLAIVRAIAEAHGGGVEVKSRPGAGSTFTIVIPVRPRTGTRTP